MGNVRDIGELSDQTFTLSGHGTELTIRARWLHMRGEPIMGSAIGRDGAPLAFEQRSLQQLTLSDGTATIALKTDAVRDLMTFLANFVEPHEHYFPSVVGRPLKR